MLPYLLSWVTSSPIQAGQLTGWSSESSSTSATMRPALAPWKVSTSQMWPFSLMIVRVFSIGTPSENSLISWASASGIWYSYSLRVMLLASASRGLVFTLIVAISSSIRTLMTRGESIQR